jgi:hypothetical protein
MRRPPGIEALKFQRDMRRNMTEPEKRLASRPQSPDRQRQVP